MGVNDRLHFQSDSSCQGKGGDFRRKYYLTLTRIPLGTMVTGAAASLLPARYITA